MNREELIKNIRKEGCHLAELVHDLIRRAVTEDEEILGKYLKSKEIEVKNTGVPTVEYSCYIVTDRKFVRIFASESEYWFRVCPLNRFMGLEEKNLPRWGGIDVDDIDVFVKAGFPGELEVKIYFDVTGEDLRQVTLVSEGLENRKIKEFVSATMAAISALQKK